MANRFVNVAISRQSQAIAQTGFGVPLILATEKDFVYKEYADIDLIEPDFGTSTNTYKLAQALFGQSPKIAKVAIVGVLFTEGTTATSALTNKLNATRLVNDDWYYLLCPSHVDATITALASWATTTNKIYFSSTSSKTLAATLNSDRAVVLVHPTPAQNPGEAWVGVCAPKEIGSYTWTFKTLAGIDPAGYTAAEVDTIEAANGSTYIKEGGVNITSKGVTTSGEYIDIIQGQDYIAARITENVFSLLVSVDKVPYNQQGIAMVVAELEKALKNAFDQGIIAADVDGNPSFSVIAPEINDISSSDRASRLLPNIQWGATIAGAVEDVDINGVLTL